MPIPPTSSVFGFVLSIFGCLLLRCALHGRLERFPQDLLLREFVVDVRALSTCCYGRALFLFLGRDGLLFRLSLRDIFIFLLFLGTSDLLLGRQRS